MTVAIADCGRDARESAAGTAAFILTATINAAIK
jgi:hypothetical protein